MNGAFEMVEDQVPPVVARRLRQVREQKRWTQGDLALRVTAFGNPMHQTTIAKIENGSRKVTVEEWLQLAAALDVAPVTLLLDDGGQPLELGNVLRIEQPAAQEWISGLRPLPLAWAVEDDEYLLAGQEVTGEEADARREWFEQTGTLRDRRASRTDGARHLVRMSQQLADAMSSVRIAEADGEPSPEARSVAANTMQGIRRELGRMAERIEFHGWEKF